MGVRWHAIIETAARVRFVVFWRTGRVVTITRCATEPTAESEIDGTPPRGSAGREAGGAPKPELP